MARVRIYIKPFNPDGTYADEYVEVTDDVVGSPSTIKQEIDGSDFDIGVLKNSSFTLKLLNSTGKYSEAGDINSIFGYKRSDSLVKVTWDVADQDFNLGTSMLDDLLDEEVDAFIGLLSDDSAATNIPESEVSFRVLGREALLDRVVAPTYGSDSPILASYAILATLDQARITDLLTVSAGNINVGNDIEFASNDDLNNALGGRTGKDALQELLLLSNSVLSINDDDEIVVSARTAGVAVAKTFYGQTSPNGAENIVAITDVRSGQNRLFNYFTWRDGATPDAYNASSVEKYGYFRREINSDLLTDAPTQASVLAALLAEFGDLKKEFSITVPLDYDTLALRILDRVAVEYPALIVSTTEEPIYGEAEYGVDSYPAVNEAFSWLLADELKIISREVNLADQTVKLKLRKI